MSEKIIKDLEDKTRQLSLPKREEMEAMNKLIAGRTGSGKTMYLLKDLEDNLMDKYDDIYLICPTYKTNYCYQNWEFKNSTNWHPLHVNLDDVDYVLSILSKNIRGKTLIILDDCASAKSVSKHKSILTRLAMGGRHSWINTIVLTQQITSIANSYRDNLTEIVTFFNPSKLDRRILFDTMCSHKKDEEEEIMKKLMNHKFSYFHVSLKHPWECEVYIP